MTTNTHLMTLLTEALSLLDAAIQHRESALAQDAISQMIAREKWGHYLTALGKLRAKVAAVAQKQA